MELRAGHGVQAIRDIRRGYGGGRYVMFGSRGMVTHVNSGRYLSYVVEFLTDGFFGERQALVVVHDVLPDDVRAPFARFRRPGRQAQGGAAVVRLRPLLPDFG